MNRSLLLLAAWGATLAVRAQNTCQTALPITAGTYVVSGIDGSGIPDPVCSQTSGNGTAGEWYTYTTLVDTSVTISTLTAGVDTRLHVYAGVCGALVCVAGDDDSGPGNTSLATFTALAGTAYVIAFDDRWSAAGFNFMLSEGAIPPNPGEHVTFSSETITGWSQGQPIGAVDMNGDYLDDIVVPGTSALFIDHQLAGGGFAPFNFQHPTLANQNVLCIAAGDLDGNGFNDMLYGGGGGVSFMMANTDGTVYTENHFPQFVFCQRTNMVDIDNDGNLDGYSCHDIDANVYYLGDGNGNLVFHQGDFGTTGGNYGSIWIDHDNDGDVDLYITKCASDPVDQLWRNDGGGAYTNVAAAFGFAVVHQAWSSAWGDYDNDGDLDLLIGGSGNTDHRLYRNEVGSYTDVSAGSGIAGVNGSIEWRTYDFNNDGYLDILSNVGLFYNNGDMTFTHVPNANLSGAIGDLNNDGFMDIMVPPNTLWWNQGNDNNWITVALQGTVSNPNGIGARVRIITPMGQQIRDVVSGDGFRFMSSLNAHFGIGADTEIEQVEVHWPSGIVDVITAPPINGTLVVIEGLNTGIAHASDAAALTVFPNPANDRITLRGDASVLNAPVIVFDPAGKCVLRGQLRNGQLDVSALSPGTYVLALCDGTHLRFTKN